MSDFSGQKVIITGATRGIGKAIAEAFLRQGATVIGVYAANTAAADQFQAECAQYGAHLQLKQCDISDYKSVENFYSKIEEEFDAVDILINNAGIRRDSVLAMMPLSDWQQVLDINLTGSYAMAKFAVQLMMKQKYGRIIFITSPMAHMGFAGQSNYAASKAGQIAMMKSLSKETAKRKITANCVSPGFVTTDLINDLSEEMKREYKNMVPMKRFGTPEDVAHAVLFLSSREAGYITGAVLEVTGGL